MPALHIDPSESALPSHLLPPSAGSPASAWNAYRAAARAAGCYRASKAVMTPVVIKSLPPPAPPPNPVAVRSEYDLPKGLIPGRPPISRIICACANEFGVKPTDIVGGGRMAETVLPRHVAMYVAREFTTRSLPEIGRMMGGRDHTTVLSGYLKIARMISTDTVLAARVESIKAAVVGGGEA